MIEKLGRKLSQWKGNYLLIGGKLIMLKSVLVGMSIYWFSIYKAPMSVIHKLEKLQRDFL